MRTAEPSGATRPALGEARVGSSTCAKAGTLAPAWLTLSAVSWRTPWATKVRNAESVMRRLRCVTTIVTFSDGVPLPPASKTVAAFADSVWTSFGLPLGLSARMPPNA